MSATTVAALARRIRPGLRALRLPALPRPILPLLALPLLSACGTAAEAPAEPQVQKAWVRLPAVPGRPAAGYLTLVGGTRDATLVAVTTPAAARTELHETMKMDAPGAPDHAGHEGMAGMSGATTMRPLESLPLPAGQTVKLTPGSRHLMLFDLDASIVPGRAVPLRLQFADGTSVLAEAQAVAAGDAGMK